MYVKPCACLSDTLGLQSMHKQFSFLKRFPFFPSVGILLKLVPQLSALPFVHKFLLFLFPSVLLQEVGIFDWCHFPQLESASCVWYDVEVHHSQRQEVLVVVYGHELPSDHTPVFICLRVLVHLVKASADVVQFLDKLSLLSSMSVYVCWLLCMRRDCSSSRSTCLLS